MKFHKRNYIQEAKELNITAFMNLMVILVPFLLITAVFSRMTVLEINLPVLDAALQNDEKVELQLELQVSLQQVIVQDARLGPIKVFSMDEISKSNWKMFTETLLEIKRKFPEKDSVTLLFEKDVAYKNLIQIMDHVKSTKVVQIDTVVEVELFPNVSIGDAGLPQIVESDSVSSSTATESKP